MLTSAQTGKSQAAHFLAHKVQEFNFRLSELLSVTEESSRRFAAKTGDAPKAGRLVNFHFSALSTLVQTFKDLLPAMTGSRVSWNQLANVRHLEFLRDVRNAITHDGNPVINMWVDGRFYVGADFVRQDQRGHPVLIRAPQKDIHALVLEFAEDFCTYLRAVVIPLLGLLCTSRQRTCLSDRTDAATT